MIEKLTAIGLAEEVRFLRSGLNRGLAPDVLLGAHPEHIQEQIWEEYRQQELDVQQIIRPAILEDAPRRKPWNDTFNSAEGIYWSRLYEFLQVHKGRSPSEVASLDEASDEILFRLGDPKEIGPGLEKVRGLVIGYVQSGKTANYTALVAKAFDAGYKAVFVLTGIHNSLRRQTQIRLNDELGLVGSTTHRLTADAVKRLPSADKIITMTSEELLSGDFSANISNHLLQTSRCLFVTKKNKSVLERLNNWLSDVKDVPALIIDDEADQASVNTAGNRVQYVEEEGESDLTDAAKEDISPTAINGEIRKLVSKFHNVSYVGYTATPYANVFIQHDAEDAVVGDDLYPRDFIVSLPKPKGYFGPEEFFGTAVTDEEGPDPSISDEVIRIVPEEEIQAFSEIKSHPEKPSDNIPLSLQAAVADFLLALAARKAEGHESKPGTMLVHVSHRAEEQKELRDALDSYIRDLRAKWRFQRGKASEYWLGEWSRFAGRHHDSLGSYSFDVISEFLELWLSQYSTLEVMLFNHLSQDELDYEANPTLTAIVVGGNKLSRGLTLEGLLVSYFVRSSSAPKADTLTQMGRFFGYREAVFHLTRIYTTHQLRSDFREISLVENSLRKEILRYSLSGKTPNDFAPRVLRRARLLPTAKNKMQSASLASVSYSGDLVQTTSFPSKSQRCRCDRHPSALEHNDAITAKFLEKLTDAQEDRSAPERNRILFPNVEVSKVLEYLDDYQVVSGATRFSVEYLTRYIRDLNESQTPELTNWDVALVGRSNEPELGSFGEKRAWEIGRIQRALANDSSNSIGSLINPLNLKDGSGDELLGMTPEQINEAKLLTKDLRFKNADALRTVRHPGKGLLCIYPISPASIGRTDGKDRTRTLGEALGLKNDQTVTVVGLSIVFPHSNDDQSGREYWVGTAGHLGHQ